MSGNFKFYYYMEIVFILIGIKYSRVIKGKVILGGINRKFYGAKGRDFFGISRSF